MKRACAFGDPYCPCQDDDACHYVDMPGSPAMKPPVPDIAEKPDPETDPYFIDRAIGQRENFRGWE
jgi:hypothetical protein